MAARAAAGADLRELRDELLAEIWPWALDAAERAAWRRGSHLDPDELRSQLLYAVFQATCRIDWERWRTWPRLLQQRVEGAQIEAWRAADVLGRGHRQIKQRFQALVDNETQGQGRTLPGAERERLAASLLGDAPRRGTWLDAILADQPLSEPLDLSSTERRHVSGSAEDIVVARESARGVHEWLENDVPAEVAVKVREWLAGKPRALPANLRSSLATHRRSLRMRVDAAAS